MGEERKERVDRRERKSANEQTRECKKENNKVKHK